MNKASLYLVITLFITLIYIVGQPTLAEDIKKDEISVGTKIYDTFYEKEGKVVEILANGKVKIDLGSDVKVVDRQIVSVSTSCLGEICKNNRVYYPFYSKAGNVSEIYSSTAKSGTAKIKLDGSWFKYNFVTTEVIYKSVACINGICTGNRIYDSFYDESGTVTEIFSDGTAHVDYDKMGLKFTNTKTLDKIIVKKEKENASDESSRNRAKKVNDNSSDASTSYFNNSVSK